MTARIPIRDRSGAVIAEAIIDADMERFLSVWSWRLTSNGYVVRHVSRSGGSGRTVSMARIVAGLMEGDMISGDEITVDHINRNRLDNRRDNLRFALRWQNNQNTSPRTTYRGKPRTGYRGVHQLPSGRWHARACVRGVDHNLGTYDTELEAAEVAARFRAEHMPFSVELLP